MSRGTYSFRLVATLCLVIVVQIFVILDLYASKREENNVLSSKISNQNNKLDDKNSLALTNIKKCDETKMLGTITSLKKQSSRIGGVAATIFLGAPKWFQNRYTLMINQVITSIPSDWVVQIFYNDDSHMAREGVNHNGVRKQISNGKIVLTPLPKEFKKIKRNALFVSRWLWANMLSDHVLIFGGTTVPCANSAYNLGDFIGKYDYIG